MTLPIRKSGLTRNSPFGFSCNRCIECCKFKRIQLNPYEIARLAENKNITTTEFIARYTTQDGTFLRTREDQSCIFLDRNGCSVHSDRPLVCRLYPLGRYVDYSGQETFAQFVPEEGCEGIFLGNGTVGQYLDAQDAYPFMRAADAYLELLWWLLEKLKDQANDVDQAESVLETVENMKAGGAAGQDGSWVDMDRVVSAYCKRSDVPVPVGKDEKMAVHIKAVREWAAQPK